MILSETLGLWLSSIVRGGIGWCRRLACFKHGPDRYDCYFPSNRASQESDGPPPGNGPPVMETDSQPEALKLLVVSNSWRRNVPPSSTRSR
jgi:hypothetical protein